jgi:hypothetical protein
MKSYDLLKQYPNGGTLPPEWWKIRVLSVLDSLLQSPLGEGGLIKWGQLAIFNVTRQKLGEGPRN